MREYFKRVLGNNDARGRVGVAIESGRNAHAFLIGGPSGSGKRTFATEIAAALNCEKRNDSSGTPLPCGRCQACLRIYNGGFTDVKITEKPKDRATLGVAQIKDLREDMFLSATESEHKVYIIDDAETMTVEAQNALLKVLEEPPRGVVIILLATECDKILTTIKSRVQFISTERFSPRELTAHLRSHVAEARGLGDAELMEIAVSSDGRLGEAIRLTDSKQAAQRREMREAVDGVIRAAIRKSYKDLREAVAALPTKRVELSEYIELMINAIRDTIAVRSAESVPLVYFISADDALKCIGSTERERLLEIYDKISEAYVYLTKNANVQSLLANLTAGLAR
jgi:DNA polymerase-3 subunit delta'